MIAPMSQYELDFLRQSGQWQRFQDFKRMLAANGPFWDFPGYNAIARSDKLFRDATHMKPATGEMVLRMVMGKNSTPCNAATAESGVLIQPYSVEIALAAAGPEAPGRDRFGVALCQDRGAGARRARGEESAGTGSAGSDTRSKARLAEPPERPVKRRSPRDRAVA